MNPSHFITGPRKVLFYTRIALHVAAHYALRPYLLHWNPFLYLRFLARALRLLLAFRHNKIVRVFNGWKLHLYLPAYPSPAFFYAIESKLVRTPAGPTTVVFSMTKACSYRCKHCYQRHDGGSDIEESLLLDTVRKVRDCGVAMLDIEGGEPFARYARLLNLVRALDRRTEIWVNTTGDRATPENLAELKKNGLFGLMISIHSPDSARHDAFTGVPGSFDVARATLQHARRLGLVTAVNSVLSQADVEAGRLADLMDLAKDLACDFVQLIHPKPAGEWMGRSEEMQSDERIIYALRREHLDYNSAARRDYPSLAAQVFEEAEDVLGCTAGAVDRFYVNAHGEVQPCEFLNVSFGNVNEEPYETVYARMREAFPHPCTDWLCCTQAADIHRLFKEHNLETTPLPWPVTQKLIAGWQRGKPTPLYRKLGIYRKD